MRQREAAASLGVSVDTYRGWELNRIRPYASSWRVVIEFLGYDPSPLKTIGERLRAKRRALGWTDRQAAAHLGWDYDPPVRTGGPIADRQPVGPGDGVFDRVRNPCL